MKKRLIAASAIIGLTFATSASAWVGSVGVDYPVVVAPQAVYVAPQPVYVQQPVYAPPPRPVYVAQPDYTPAVIAAGVILGGVALMSVSNGGRSYYGGRGGHYKGHGNGYRQVHHRDRGDHNRGRHHGR
jgi:hypothetical protein